MFSMQVFYTRFTVVINLVNIFRDVILARLKIICCSVENRANPRPHLWDFTVYVVENPATTPAA